MTSTRTGERAENESAKGMLDRFMLLQRRQARHLAGDFIRMRGLMPLLMKHRNGGRWTAEERAELVMQLRVLSRVSPVLLLLLLPGSALLLPIYAWWLDRRRAPRPPQDSQTP